MVIIITFRKMLKENGRVRKIFGRKEIGIILKQLEGVSLKPSEKNRLSRDIRPKFRVIQELSRFQQDFELKKGADKQKLIGKIIDSILKDELKDSVKAILLFGSHAKGIITHRSDIDICVVFSNISIKEATRFRARISGEFSVKVDIQVFNVLPQKIKRAIARSHKVLYEKNFDNLSFTIRHLKDEDYFIRMKRIMGEII